MRVSEKTRGAAGVGVTVCTNKENNDRNIIYHVLTTYFLL